MSRAVFVTSLWVILAWAGPANGQTTTMPGTPFAVATIYSIGVEWPIVGDSNHNAAATG